MVLSGALFPLKGLPGLLGWLTKADPLTYGIDGIRAVLLQQGIFDPRTDLAVLIVLSAILLVFGAYRFSKIEI